MILLVIVCAGIAAWNAYLLFTDQTDPLTGWIIFAVSVGVLLWNTSVLRAYRVGVGRIVAVTLVVILLGGTIGAFAGVEPLAGIKNTLASKVAPLGGDMAAPETESEAMQVVQAVIRAYNEGRADRLADLTSSQVYKALTSWTFGGSVSHLLVGLGQIVDYDLTMIYSDTWNRRYSVGVRGGIKELGWPVVYPYDATYEVGLEGGRLVVTQINLRRP